MKRFQRDCLRLHGETHAKLGKPIEAFYELPLTRHTESRRAEYEIGYRAEKERQRHEQATHVVPERGR